MSAQGEIRQLLRKLPPSLQAAFALAAASQGAPGGARPGAAAAHREVMRGGGAAAQKGNDANADAQEQAGAIEALLKKFRTSTGCGAG